MNVVTSPNRPEYPRVMDVGIRVSGMTPLTTIDFPDHLACVLYTQGCPLRCGYCHNQELIPFETDKLLAWQEVDEFLQRRQGILEAVVFSGGEPTMQPELRRAMLAVIERGYKVGLHTAGVSPSGLAEVLGLVDWVGLDVKALPHLYNRVTGRRNQSTKNRQSLELLLASGTDFECRTTVSWQLMAADDVLMLARQLAAMGVTRYALQINHGNNCLDPMLAKPFPLPVERKRALQRELEGLFPVFEWRE